MRTKFCLQYCEDRCDCGAREELEAQLLAFNGGLAQAEFFRRPAPHAETVVLPPRARGDGPSS